jgi:CHAT domain-containing protein/tetratricopeptide (TPR) repeat protein
MKIAYLFFLLCFPFLSFTQNVTSDTIEARKLKNIGKELQKKSELKKANTYYEKVLSLYKKHEIHREYLIVKSYIASNLRKLREYEVAASLSEEIIKESRQYFGEGDEIEGVAYNVLAIIASTNNQYDEAIEIYQKVVTIFEKTKNQKNLCASYNNIGIAYYYKNDLGKALDYFKEYERCLISSGEKPNYAVLYGNSAAICIALGDYEEALEYTTEAIDWVEEEQPDNWRRLLKQYINCSNVCEKLRQPTRALNYLEKAERLLEGSEDVASLTTIYSLRAVIHKGQNQVEKSIKYLRKEELLYSDKPSNYLKLAQCYNNLLGLYGELGNEEKFHFYSQKAIGIYEKLGNEKLRGLSNCYKNIALFYSRKRDVEQYDYYASLSLSLEQEMYGAKHPLIAELYKISGKFYKNEGEYEKALSFLKQAITANVAHEKVDLKTTLDNQDYLDLNVFQSTVLQLSLLYKEWYQKTKHESYLKKSYEYGLLAQEILFTQRETLSQNDDKKVLLAKAHNTIANTILTTELYYTFNSKQEHIETALQAAEKSKSIILLESLKGNAAEKFGGLPDSVQKKEANLKEQIAKLEKKIIDAKGSQENELQKKFKNQLFDQKRALEKLYDRIKSDFPKYVQMKKGGTDFNLQTFQKEILDDKTALIEYFMADSSCFMFVIRNKKVEFIKLPITSVLIEQKVKELRRVLSNYKYILEDKKRAYKEYTKVAHWFYKELFAAAVPHIKDVEHLIFVPDGTLGHLPFDVFLVEEPVEELPYNKLHYLLQDYSIRYSYSAALLLENKKGQAKPSSKETLNLYVFAGNYDVVDSNLLERTLLQQKIRKQLIPLPAVVAELNQLKRLFKEGHYYSGAAANELNFKKQATKMDVLHLAMHGILNTNYPFASSLIFTENHDSIEDNFLYAYEISQLNFSANLVVLSACETGYGRFEQGEGVMSLARSFMYAGVPSLVVSLWQVNDASTALIMQAFYTYLKEGLPKDLALRKAKLDYLKVGTGIAAHPAYWAPFIQIGTADALVEKAGSKFGWWIGGFSLLLGMLFFIIRRKK